VSTSHRPHHLYPPPKTLSHASTGSPCEQSVSHSSAPLYHESACTPPRIICIPFLSHALGPRISRPRAQRRNECLCFVTALQRLCFATLDRHRQGVDYQEMRAGRYNSDSQYYPTRHSQSPSRSRVSYVSPSRAPRGSTTYGY
jgi:hypothetical protein